MEKQILLVEDRPEWIAIEKEILGEINAKVRTASSVQEALEKISDHCPDVIVLDLGLPVSNADPGGIEGDAGLQVLDHVKCKGLLCPVIVLTASRVTSLYRRSREAGAFSVIWKREADLRTELVPDVKSVLAKWTIGIVDDILVEREGLAEGLRANLKDDKDGFNVVDLDLIRAQASDVIARLQSRPGCLPLGLIVDYSVPLEQLPEGVTDNGFYCKELLEGLERWEDFQSILVLVESIKISFACVPQWLADLRERNEANVHILRSAAAHVAHYAMRLRDWRDKMEGKT